MAASITRTQPSAPMLLSEYEQARAKNIERNNARLRSLGLISFLEERRSNDTAWGRQNHGGDNDGSDSPSDDEYVDGDGITKSEKKKKRSRFKVSPAEGSRKSRRLTKLSSQAVPGDTMGDGGETSVDSDAAVAKHRSQMEREALVAECREARLRVANELANAGVVEAKGNPTASYEHCLMRVRSMTEKSLANRIRTIERAAGKHCVVKMAIFKSCLQDQDMWDLATLASESLERLKALLPPP